MNDAQLLIYEIEKIEKIRDSDIEGRIKCQLVLGKSASRVEPLLKKVGLELDYYDPDISYEEDTNALVNALVDLKARIQKISGYT